MKIIRIIYCFIICSFFVVPLFLSIIHKDVDVNLIGVTINEKYPSFRKKAIWTGVYQSRLEKYYSENFPLRGLFIKGYDQLVFDLGGGEINNICPGVKKDLHGKMWINGYINYIISKDIIKSFFNDIEIIKNYYDKNNKKLLYIISPNKAELYDESLPWNYQLYLKKQRYNNLAIARKQINDNLKAANILAIDTLPLMKELRKNGLFEPFSKTGIHWNSFGASQALCSIISFFNNNNEDKIQNYTVSYYGDKDPEPADVDYQQLLNVFFAETDNIYPHIENMLLNNINNTLQVFAMTTSYHNYFMEIFKRYGMPFYRFKRLYYNQLQTDLVYENGRVVGDLFTPGVPLDQVNYEEITNFDILVIEHNAGELPLAHIEFVHRYALFLKENKS